MISRPVPSHPPSAVRAGLSAIALSLAAAACATAQEVLPCWVDVRVDHRASAGQGLVTQTSLADASRVVDARLGAYGVERTVFTWQTDELIVGLPAASATDRVFDLIVAEGRAAFVPVPLGEEAPEPGQPVPAEWEPLFGSADIGRVELTSERDMLALQFEFSPSGRQLLGVWSGANVNRQLIVALDGEVVFAPTVATPLRDGSLQLTGPQDERMAWFASALAFGPLPVTLAQTAVQEVDTGECPAE